MPHRLRDFEGLPGLPTIVGHPKFDTSGFGALLVQNAGLGTQLLAYERRSRNKKEHNCKPVKMIQRPSVTPLTFTVEYRKYNALLTRVRLRQSILSFIKPLKILIPQRLATTMSDASRASFGRSINWHVQ